MKITITPGGDVTFSDVDDMASAVAFINAIRQPDATFKLAETAAEFQRRKALWEAAHPQIVAAENAVKAKRKAKRKPKRRTQASRNAQLGDTYNWLMSVSDQDTLGSIRGGAPAQAAAALGITNSLASYRLRRLVAQGMAERVGRGRYVAK